MKILVGYDGSNASFDALRLARKHAKAFNAKIDVVTSLEKGDMSNFQDIEEAEQRLAYAHFLRRMQL